MTAVYVWIETFNGKPVSTAWEGLGAARPLADQFGVPLTALVFGENASDIAQTAGQYGADAALVCEDSSLAEFRLEPYAALLSKLVQANAPRLVLAVGSNRGRELLAASAADTDSPMLPDATDITLNADAIKVMRPAYAGKLLNEMSASAATVFISTRGRAFAPLTKNADASIDVASVEAAMDEDAISTKVEAFEAETDQVSLTDAAIIVSGGRGMANNPAEPPTDATDPTIWKAQHGFAHTLQPLADALGAALGASRAAVDAGYIDYEHQVGQTGKTVNPDVYIATGISGAIQHQAGMRNSKIIVAINKDPDAPIFKLARYGIVGDLYDIIPALTAAIKQRDGS